MSYEYSCIQNIEPERGKVMLHHPRENSGLKTMENGELKKKISYLEIHWHHCFLKQKGPDSSEISLLIFIKAPLREWKSSEGWDVECWISASYKHLKIVILSGNTATILVTKALNNWFNPPRGDHFKDIYYLYPTVAFPPFKWKSHYLTWFLHLSEIHLNTQKSSYPPCFARYHYIIWCLKLWSYLLLIRWRSY